MSNWGNIPIELREKQQWVCWVFEDREGKPAKVPKNPNGTGNAMPNQSNTWSTFSKAIKKVESRNYSGIGFMFNGNGILGVDLDKCRDPETGSLNEVAKDIISILDSYTEISQSGTGIHIICTGKLPEGKRRKGSVEMYESGRFFIVTGDIIDDGHSTIEERTRELAIIHKKYLEVPKANKKPTPAAPIVPADLSEDELIKKAINAKNGYLFKSLMDGTWSGNYSSQSEADLAICNILAFWTGKNEQMMQSIIRRSSIYRGKWDERRGQHTYGQITIRKAIAGTTEVYTPRKPKIKSSAPETVPPDQDLGYDKLYGPVVDEPIENIFYSEDTTSDLGRSKIFSKKYMEKVLWCRDARDWYVWDGQKWASGAEMNVMQLAKELVPEMIIHANKFVVAATGEEELKKAKSTYHDTLKAKTERCIKSMIELAKSDLFVNAEKFDADPFLLNCQNGVVDLRTGQLLAHDSKLYLSKMVRANYIPGSTFKLFGSFLELITCNDKELQNYFQIVCGMAAVGKVFHEGIAIFHGGGQNGKSSFLNCISKVFGDYSCSLNPEMLMAQKDGRQPVGITKIEGKRFVTAIETEEGRRLSGAMLKQLASTDLITGREMYQKERSFQPTHTLIMATNHLPKVGSIDTGTWRRIAVVPFNANIEGKKQIKDYAELLAKTDGDAILTWIVEGARRYIKNNYQIDLPEAVKNYTAEYREDEDWVSKFISECCEIGNYEEAGKKMYETYKKWCDSTNEYGRKPGDFAQSLKAKGFEIKKKKYGNFWIGLKVKTIVYEGYLKQYHANNTYDNSLLDDDELDSITRSKM